MRDDYGNANVGWHQARRKHEDDVKQDCLHCQLIEEAIQNIDLKVNDYKNMGYVISGIDEKTHNPIRTKLRNYNYELVRKLRGNQPKLQFRYLMLHKEGKIKAYLEYYPEHKDIFLKI